MFSINVIALFGLYFTRNYGFDMNLIYRDLWNMENLVNFKFGNFSFFYNLNSTEQIKISLIYIFLSELYKSRDTKIFMYCTNENDRFLKILCYYKYFMYCLSTTNTINDRNQCNPFFKEICYLYEPIPPSPMPFTTQIPWNYTVNMTTQIPIITTAPYFNFTSEVHKIFILKNESFPWNKSFLNDLDHEIPLVIFNLFLCTMNEYKYLCPELCLGKSDLCSGIDNLHSLGCSTFSSWNEEIFKLLDLVNNKFNFNSIVYSCDCNHGFTWSFKARECAFGGLFPNPCDPISLAPCFEPGTTACVGDSYSGEYLCRCKPQYVGVLCENIIDACQMEVVTLDGNTEDETSNSYISSGNRKTGFEMCQVNMSGLATKGHPNKCIPVLGTRKYECVCQYPFLEDLDYKVSNCLKRETACYNELCINGVCKESENSDDSLCVCFEDYEGLMCEHKITLWAHWSECSPECGMDRTRFRERESFTGLVYQQIEICPNRVDEDCPLSQSEGINLPLPFTNEELEFYSFYFFTSAIGVGCLAIIMYLSQLITSPRFVGARQREIETNKAKRSQEKQKFSLWKIEQLQKEMQ